MQQKIKKSWKGFEFLPLGRELKAQTDIAKKQYQKLDNNREFDKIIKKEKPTLRSIVNEIRTVIIAFINIIVVLKNLRTFL